MANFYKLCTIYEHQWLTIVSYIRINSYLKYMYYLSKAPMTYVINQNQYGMYQVYTSVSLVCNARLASSGNWLFSNLFQDGSCDGLSHVELMIVNCFELVTIKNMK